MTNFTAGCDLGAANSFHGAGIHAAMIDGSVRLLALGISQQSWTALLSPRSDDFPGSDYP